MKKILIASLLLCFLPGICIASGDNNAFEYAQVISYIMSFGVFTAVLNIVSYMVAARSYSLFTLGMLWTCFVLNAACLCLCIFVMINRYHQHMILQAEGDAFDKVEYTDFNSKALLMLMMIVAAIIVDIVLITKKKNERKSREEWFNR